MPKAEKIVVACVSGAGTSMMMKMAVEKATKELGIPVEKIHQCSISEGKSTASQYDIVVCALNFADNFTDKGAAVVAVKNVMSADEIKERLLETEFAPK